MGLMTITYFFVASLTHLILFYFFFFIVVVFATH